MTRDCTNIELLDWPSLSPEARNALVEGCGEAVMIVVDAFRAFATAAEILARGPARYRLCTRDDDVKRLLQRDPGAFLVGKPERGSDLTYHVPNSPTRIRAAAVANRTVVHRTQAGAFGAEQFADAHLTLCASFVNAGATARVAAAQSKPVIIVTMGHEATHSTQEDRICGAYLRHALDAGPPVLASTLAEIRAGSAAFFVDPDDGEYPIRDGQLCCALDSFDFAIKARRADVGVALSPIAS